MVKFIIKSDKGRLESSLPFFKKMSKHQRGIKYIGINPQIINGD